jgi:hypothetical protein
MNTSSRPYAPSPATSPKASQASDAIADMARGAGDAVKNTVGDAIDRGQTAVSRATTAASDMADTATDQVKTFASELEAMTRRNPLGTLAGAVMAGVLIGLFARGRP